MIFNKVFINSRKGIRPRTPIFAQSIIRILEQAWLLASAEQNSMIRSAHILVALLTAPELYQVALRASPRFELFPIDTMKRQFLEICEPSIENQHHTAPSTIQENPSSLQQKVNTTPTLDQYTTNLTKKARQGRIDPVIGREFEIRLMLDILMRRRQNNPILTGDPGVGKTEVVEGLALKIVNHQVPDIHKKCTAACAGYGLITSGCQCKRRI